MFPRSKSRSQKSEVRSQKSEDGSTISLLALLSPDSCLRAPSFSFSPLVKRQRHHSRGGAPPTDFDFDALARLELESAPVAAGIGHADVLFQEWGRRPAGDAPDLLVPDPDGIAVARRRPVRHLKSD